MSGSKDEDKEQLNIIDPLSNDDIKTLVKHFYDLHVRKDNKGVICSRHHWRDINSNMKNVCNVVLPKWWLKAHAVRLRSHPVLRMKLRTWRRTMMAHSTTRILRRLLVHALINEGSRAHLELLPNDSSRVADSPRWGRQHQPPEQQQQQQWHGEKAMLDACSLESCRRLIRSSIHPYH
jgi:hypothetical protein